MVTGAGFAVILTAVAYTNLVCSALLIPISYVIRGGIQRKLSTEIIAMANHGFPWGL